MICQKMLQVHSVLGVKHPSKNWQNFVPDKIEDPHSRGKVTAHENEENTQNFLEETLFFPLYFWNIMACGFTLK